MIVFVATHNAIMIKIKSMRMLFINIILFYRTSICLPETI